MENYKIYDNVEMGEGVYIGDFVVIGVPPRGYQAGEIKTVIGKNAYIRSHSVIYAGNVIGDNLQTGHFSFIREFNEIGDNFKLGTKCMVEHHCKIGQNVSVQSMTTLSEYTTIEDDCWLGPHSSYENGFHPTCPMIKKCIKGPTVKKGAIVGGNVVLGPGVVIGEKAFICHGSVVNKDVPDNMVAVGHPAKVVKEIYDMKCPYGFIDRPYQKNKAPLLASVKIK